jgi:hypothetical protein
MPSCAIPTHGKFLTGCVTLTDAQLGYLGA